METVLLEKIEISIADEELENVTFSKWDPAEEIETKEDVIAEIKYSIEDGDFEYLLDSLGDIVRSEGFTEIARELGLTPASLRHTIAPAGALAFESVIKLLDLMGFRLRVAPKSA